MRHSGTALVEPRWMAANYRRNARDTERDRNAQESLVQAGDAIHLAILTIAHHVGEEGSERLHRRIARVQEHLIDACHALTRAKLDVAGLWTYAPEVILNQDPDPEREIARLNRITTTLAMRNHKLLPKNPEAAPLSAVDEAQLAAVSQEVSLSWRAHRAGIVAWFCLAVAAILVTGWIGAAGWGAALLFSILGVSQCRGALRVSETPLSLGEG